MDPKPKHPQELRQIADRGPNAETAQNVPIDSLQLADTGAAQVG